jgi:predicted ribosome quality control (RQC) complex YloA/Tae2 family protein
MSGKNSDLQGVLEVLLPEIRETRSIAQETSVQLASLNGHVGQMDGQISQIAKSQLRMEEAIFGNGKPGMKAEIDDLRDEVDRLKNIENRRDQEKQKQRDEFRKFRWGFLAAIFTALLDILLRVFNGID